VILLLAFAFLAGAGTALSPCVLPILPVVAAAGVTGGRRRPLGIAVGLGLAFTFAAVALVYVIDALGLPDDVQRTVAIVVLAGFGLAVAIPAIGDRVEALLSRVVGAPRMRRGEGFGSGMLVGAGLGLVYFPCAGPILAGVITLSASQSLTLDRLLVVAAYAAGSAAVLYVLLLGGRRLMDRLRPARGRVQVATGVLMVGAAIVLAVGLDRDFEQSIATGLPDWVTNPTSGLEDSDAVRERIADVRGTDAHTPIATPASPHQPAQPASPGSGHRLPVLNQARVPDLTDPGQFFNTPGGEPVSIHELNAEGKTVLVDFWTYTCINCIRTLPHLEAWYRRYAPEGLVVIGVHTPEFPFEKDPDNVAAAIADDGLTYPVVQDNDYGTWDAFGNQYWPAKYLIDPSGHVRYAHFGEGDYDETENAIRSLLAESGSPPGRRAGRVRAQVATRAVRLTPETYLGSDRAPSGNWTNPTLDPPGGRFGAPPRTLPTNAFAYSGTWKVEPERAVAGSSARIDARVSGKRVFLVLGPAADGGSVRVLLDGKPIADADAGSDVDEGVVRVGSQRLYSLVDLPQAGVHRLTLEPSRGVAGYAFTFG
jgi:cytochrome c biogenesis protein CcdA/thiol-disulfide isomerase/thioredoxin